MMRRPRISTLFPYTTLFRSKTGVEVAEDEIGVGHGRLVAAPAVARRTGIGAGRIGADLEQPEGIDPGDRAAARPDFDHLDHRDRKSTRLNSSHSQISYAVFC